jgi:hypothetical protein
MPVNSHHPEYDQRKAQWDRCADVIEGSDAVKEAGEAYLPKLEGQDERGYGAYKTRALFYNASSRTVDGLTGLVFRKDTRMELPLSEKEQTAMLADITQSGVTFESFSKQVVRLLLGIGRAGILVDRAPEVNGQTASPPFMQIYAAVDIINWQTRRSEGKMALSRVVLSEEAEVLSSEDPFLIDHITQFRELFINGEGNYEVGIWREKKNVDNKTSEWIKVEAIIPTLRGTAFRFIPFIVLNVTSMSLTTEKSPLIDLIDVNLSHYRSSADLEHARHYTALPTPWVAGFDTGTVLKIGSGTAWVSSDPAAHAGILEFQGAGLSECRNALEDKQRMMAVLGARLLEEQKTVGEAAETIKTRVSGEQSIMRSMAATASEGLTLAFNWMMLWLGLDGTRAKIELNKDFIDARLDPTEQQSLMLLWQSGAISQETFYYNLERGEITRPGISFEEEQQLLEAQRLVREAEQAEEPETPPAEEEQQ